MCNENLKHAPIMPIAAKPSQYGIDPSLVKRRVAELPGMCSLRLAELFPELPPVTIRAGRMHWTSFTRWPWRSCGRWT